jgi:hypothetical protein
LVPWKSKETVFHRYYHFFWLDELRHLMRRSWLVIEKLCYLDTQGKETNNARVSKNSFLLAKKSVLQSDVWNLACKAKQDT